MSRSVVSRRPRLLETAGDMTMVMMLGLFANVAAAEPGQEKQYPVVIKSPANGGYVGILDKVQGQVFQRGQPIVLVRSNQPGARWWVQEPAMATGPGHFQARSQFGNSETEDGAQFQVMILLATTAAQATPFRVGASFETLPLEIQRSQIIVVTRGLPPAAGAEPVNFAIVDNGDNVAGEQGLPNQAPIVNEQLLDAPNLENGGHERTGDDEDETAVLADQIVLSPRPLAEVERVAEVKGLAPVATHPVILMRANTDGAAWRVHDQPHVEQDGSFIGRLRCGNERTAAGTEFRFVVLLPVTNHQLRSLAVGKSMKELPLGLQRSSEIVIRRK